MAWFIIRNVVLAAAVAAALYFGCRKYLWVSPFVSSGILVLIRWIMIPGIFSEPEWRGFLMIETAMHFVVSAVIMAFAYLLMKRKTK